MRIVKNNSLTCVLHNHEAISQSLAGRTAMLALWPFYTNPSGRGCRGAAGGEADFNPVGNTRGRKKVET
jgi:hypothetical protein